MPKRKKPTQDDCCQRLLWQDLDLNPIYTLIELAKAEDLEGSGLKRKPKAPGDHSSALLDDRQSIHATLRAREKITICGMPLVALVLRGYDDALTLETLIEDGETANPGEPIGIIKGPLRNALAAERPALNFLQHLSGIATQTDRFATALKGSHTRLLDTRKNTPGYRYLEKYAVACGGGWNHRMGLFDRVMLKDNHIAAFGEDPAQGAIRSVQQSRQRSPHLLVEMEVDRIDQIQIALDAEVDIILLDNFSPKDLMKAKSLIREKAIAEISGGIDLKTISDYKRIGMDFISTGALVHKSAWVDIGLDWE